MGRRVLWAAVLLVCLGAGISSVGNASPKPRDRHCEVGGRPAWPARHTAPGVKQLSPVVVLACGHELAGPFEIVALDTSEGLYVYMEASHFAEGEELRSLRFPDSPEPTITVSGGWGFPPAETRTYGLLKADVARVAVIFHHRGQRRRLVRNPTMVQVTDSGVLAELHQTEPFGAYALSMPGCVPPKGIRAIAFDAAGRRIGSARKFSPGLAHPCNPRTWVSN